MSATLRRLAVPTVLASALLLATGPTLAGCAEPARECLPVPGLATAALRGGGWDANGRDLGEAQRKCREWGYDPAVVGSATHEACTRMVRADYCGDGTSWTVDGTWIDVGDPAGIQEPTLAREMQFEAGWGPDGAVCVASTRYAVEDATGATLLPSCWASLPRCEDRDAATAAGALLTSAVLHEPIAACE
ncbi:MAG: ADYC domain-containing protein [Sandaracinus sp.]